jgi:APA family basic amino acid/polyamine antiporter
VGAAVATLLVLASSSENFVTVYVFITLISTVAALVLYTVCAAAALKLRVTGPWAWVALIAIVYALAMFIGAGLEPTLWGLALAAAGLPVRLISRRLYRSSPAAETGPAAPPGSSA